MPPYLCTLQSGALLLVVADDKPHLFTVLSTLDDPTQCHVRELSSPFAVEVEPQFQCQLRHSSKRFKVASDASTSVHSCSQVALHMWRERQFTDCSFVSKDQGQEQVHRCIVSAACPGLSKQLELLAPGGAVCINAATREVLAAFVKFLYTGQVDELEVEESWQLLELAKDMQLPALAHACEATIAEFYEAFFLDKSHQHWAVPRPEELNAAAEAAEFTLGQALRARSLGMESLEDFFLWNSARYGWKVLNSCPILSQLPKQQAEYVRQIVATAYPPVICRWTLGVAQSVCSDAYERSGGELTHEEAAALSEWRQLAGTCDHKSADQYVVEDSALKGLVQGNDSFPAAQLGRIKLCGNGGEAEFAAAVFPSLCSALPRARLLLDQAESEACACATDSTGSCPECAACLGMEQARAALIKDSVGFQQSNQDHRALEAAAMVRAEHGDLRSEVMLRASIMAPMYGLAQQHHKSRHAAPDKDSNESEVSGFSDESDEEDEEDDMCVDMDSGDWLRSFVIKGCDQDETLDSVNSHSSSGTPNSKAQAAQSLKGELDW